LCEYHNFTCSPSYLLSSAVSKKAVWNMIAVPQVPTVCDCLTLSHLSCENRECNFEKTFWMWQQNYFLMFIHFS